MAKVTLAHLLSATAVTAVVAFGSTSARAADEAWTIDAAHSAARFSIKHMMVSNVQGQFSQVSGTVNYDGKDLNKASVDATIELGSVNTNESHRDEHLRGKDFFNVTEFPKMTYKSKKVVAEANGAFKIIGDLNLHGVTKEITLNAEPLAKPVKDAKGNLRSGTTATGSLDRKDFGINFNKALDNGGSMVGDDVKITIDVELVKKEG